MKRFAVLVCVALAGCSTTAEGSKVQVVSSPGAVQGCKYLTSVRGNQNLYGGILLSGAAHQDALAQMMNKTAAAGGNRLYYVSGNTGLGGSNLVGDAYKC